MRATAMRAMNARLVSECRIRKCKDARVLGLPMIECLSQTLPTRKFKCGRLRGDRLWNAYGSTTRMSSASPTKLLD